MEELGLAVWFALVVQPLVVMILPLMVSLSWATAHDIYSFHHPHRPIRRAAFLPISQMPIVPLFNSPPRLR